jgi:Domain of unknown function (DUF4331)
MSHHLDSPLAREDTRLDITDVYLFRGTAGTVFVMNTNSSVAGNKYPERFHPEALYEFKVDTDGDAVEDVTFRVSFGHGQTDGRQALELCRLDGLASRDRTAKGVILAQGHTKTMSSVRVACGSGRGPPESRSTSSPSCSGPSARRWRTARPST